MVTNRVYTPRDRHLPDPRQAYLLVATIRPHRGPCPSCTAPEDVYCEPGCDLTDPFAHHFDVHALGVCWTCRTIKERHPDLPATRGLLVLPNRPTRHMEGKPGKSLCGLAAVPRAVRYRW